MMQSLIPAIYPMLKAALRARLRAGRPDHARRSSSPRRCCSRSSGSTPTGGRCRTRWRSGWAFTLVGLLLLSTRRQLRDALLGAAALVGIGSSIFHPEVVARRADGVGRTARPRAVAVPGRRQPRLGARAAARRVHRAAARAGEHRLVLLLRRWSRWSCSARVGRWYSAQRRAREAARARRTARRDAAVARAGRGRRSRSSLALIFSKYFYLASLGSYYTFYLIEQFRRLGAERAAAPVRVPRRRRGRHVHRRADRRPHRPQVRDLGLDPRRAAVHAGAAVREPVLDAAS